MSEESLQTRDLISQFLIVLQKNINKYQYSNELIFSFWCNIRRDPNSDSLHTSLHFSKGLFSESASASGSLTFTF